MAAAGTTGEALLFARAGSVDFSTGLGARALGMHGADDRTIQYADSNAEWRHGGPISPRALRRDASQQVLQLDSEVAASGDATAPKTAYDTTMPPDGRDALADCVCAADRVRSAVCSTMQPPGSVTARQRAGGLGEAPSGSSSSLPATSQHGSSLDGSLLSMLSAFCTASPTSLGRSTRAGRAVSGAMAR